MTRSNCTTRSRNGRWAAATTSCAPVWTRPRHRGRFGQRFSKEDRNAAIVSIQSMTERIDGALWQRRLWGVLSSVFAALALLLASGRVVRIAELLRFGARAGHRDPVGARGDTSGRTGHGRSTRNGVGPARTRDRVPAFGGSSPHDRSPVGRCCGARLGHPRVGGRLSGGSRTPGVAMAGRPGFPARPRAVTEERIGEGQKQPKVIASRSAAPSRHHSLLAMAVSPEGSRPAVSRRRSGTNYGASSCSGNVSTTNSACD